jgi:hypothetical protein
MWTIKLLLSLENRRNVVEIMLALYSFWEYSDGGAVRTNVEEHNVSSNFSPHSVSVRPLLQSKQFN